MAIESEVVAALAGGNGTMAKRFLQTHGLTRGSGDSVAELAERIVGYVQAGKLTAADVHQLRRETLECSDKRVFLYRGDTAKMKAVGSSGFVAPIVASLDGTQIKLQPSTPTLNYVYRDPTRIRLTYSETHIFAVANRATRSFSDRKATRVIVVDANLSTGFVTIAFDSPGEHDHGATPASYFEYYQDNEAPGLLNTELVPLELFDLLHAADKAKHQSIVSPAIIRGENDDGLGVSYVGKGSAALGAYPSYGQSRGRLSLRKNGRLVWHATKPAPSLSLVRGGNSLLRDVTTTVYASPAQLRFGKHTLSHEMAYVLQTIPSIT